MTEMDILLGESLDQLKRNSSLRQLDDVEYGIDFYSNDYLGLSKQDDFEPRLQKVGATGSRLLSGNCREAVHTESWLAQTLEVEAALIFNSGYTANLGLLSCIATRHDTILYDELVHASIRDGLRLSLAKSVSFKHNDLSDLQKRGRNAQGKIFVVVESVYSMDGDGPAPLELISICKSAGWYLIVDEAHAFGLLGENGKGLFHADRKEVFARVITFGKAAGYHGAAVLGSEKLKQFLVNFCRPFIYSTSLPPGDYLQIKHQVSRVLEAEEPRGRLRELIVYFRNCFDQPGTFEVLTSNSPIQGFLVSGNDAALRLSDFLQSKGFAVKAIRSPTVKAGMERLRIILHSFNEFSQIDQLKSCLKEFGDGK